MSTHKPAVDTIIINPRKEEGNFSTIHNSIITNRRLSDGAVRLMVRLVNKAPDWKINVGFYSREFGWNHKKQARVLTELIENGYVKKTKVFAGKTKENPSGFEYDYTVSEYGNLNEAKPVVSAAEIPVQLAAEPASAFESSNQPTPAQPIVEPEMPIEEIRAEVAFTMDAAMVSKEIDKLNTNGSVATRKKIEVKMMDEFIKRIETFNSMEHIRSKLVDFYDAFAPAILKQEKKYQSSVYHDPFL